MAVAQKKETASRPPPRRWDGVATGVEIEEGAAWMAWCREPENTALRELHSRAFNALQKAQNGVTGCWRCRSCGVLVVGRRRGQQCSNPKCRQILIGWDEESRKGRAA